ncbi:hypothetical protein ACS8FA_15015, partial [Psychrobacter sp. 1Y1]|uniref:hypothetical protein n=1 Tax=Psychrobacter sp. 1Y1 TaxID=3453574 RepID=UPI003F48CE0C
MRRLLLLATIMLSLSGCAFNSIFINYPSQIAPVKAQLNSPTPQNAAKIVESETNGADGLLYAQEAGRSAQIAGNFEASKKYYQQAV